MGKSFVNLPKATQCLAAMALSQPPCGAQHVTQVAENGLHIKHGSGNIHKSHWYAIDRKGLFAGLVLYMELCTIL